MRALLRLAIVTTMLELGVTSVFAQLPNCPVRQSPGTLVQNPLALGSVNGVLQVDLAMRNGVDESGFMHYCYDYPPNTSNFIEAPTLRVNPGDEVILNLANRLTADPSHTSSMPAMDAGPGVPGTDCQGGMITDTDTNMHFHGLSIPPVCHQDDILDTVIHTGDPPFQYKFRIPENEPPGLYWYHPHPHGQTTTQVEGGAAGAIIVEGMEKYRPEVSGLKERILILRQQFYNANSWIGGPFQFTLNFQDSVPGLYQLPIVAMEPGQKEFWRFVNATTQAFIRLQLQYASVPQQLELIALDGVPLSAPEEVNNILLPPAGRAEFIVPGPAAGVSGQLWTMGVSTGVNGNPNPAQPIFNITTDESVSKVDTPPPAAHPLPAVPERFSGLENAVPTARRKLYFSELQVTPTFVKFFITVDGQRPRSFNAHERPAIVTHVGAVEDWTIENHAEEMHAFHIHQLHFLVLAEDGIKYAHPALQDTIALPPWSGSGPFPSVTLRMDFRDPEIAGMFVYHCHVLDHEDAGMMAKILVKAAGGEESNAAGQSPKTAALRKSKSRQSGL